MLRSSLGFLLLQIGSATASAPSAEPSQADTVNASTDTWLRQQSFEERWRYGGGLANMSGLPWFRHYRFFTEPCPSWDGSSHIPRIIHQAGASAAASELPPELTKMVDRLKGLNPGWEHRYYSHDDRDAYVATHFPEMLPHYRAINPESGAAQVALFRYLVVYREGGVYLDLESTALVPLDSLLKADDEYVLLPSFSRPCCRDHRPELATFAIMSRPRHPFLKAVIERVSGNIAAESEKPGSFGNSSDTHRIARLMGSYAYTDTVYPMLDQSNHRPLIGTCVAPVIHTFLTAGAHTEEYLPDQGRDQDLKSNLVSASKPLKYVSLEENEGRGGVDLPERRVTKAAGMCAAIVFTNVTSVEWKEMLSVLLHTLAEHEPDLRIRLQLDADSLPPASWRADLARRNVTIIHHESFAHRVDKGAFEWRGARATSTLSKYSSFGYTDCSYVLNLDVDVMVRKPFVNDLLDACNGDAGNEWDICGVSDLPEGEKPVGIKADILSLRSPNSGMWLVRPNRSKEVVVRDFVADWDFERSMGALEQEIATLLGDRGVFSFSWVSMKFNQGPLHLMPPDAYIYHFAGILKPYVQYERLGSDANPAAHEWISVRGQLDHLIGEKDEVAIVTLFYTLSPELLQMLTVFEATLRKHEPDLPLVLLVEKSMRLPHELVRDLETKRILTQRYTSLDLPNPRNVRHLLQGDKMMLFSLTQYKHVVYMDLDQIILRPFVNDLHAACVGAFSGEQFDVCGLPHEVSDGHIWGSLWFVRPDAALFGSMTDSLRTRLAELEQEAFSTTELIPGIDEVAQVFLEQAGKLRVARVHNRHFNAQPGPMLEMLQKDSIYIYHFLGPKPTELLKVHGNDAPPYVLAWEKALKGVPAVIGDMVPAQDSASGKSGSQLNAEPPPIHKIQRLYAFEIEDCVVQNCLGPYLKVNQIANFRVFLRKRTTLMMHRRDWTLAWPMLHEVISMPFNIVGLFDRNEMPVVLDVASCMTANACLSRGGSVGASWMEQRFFDYVHVIVLLFYLAGLCVFGGVIRLVCTRDFGVVSFVTRLLMRHYASRTKAAVHAGALAFLVVGLALAAEPRRVTPQSVICDAMEGNATAVQVGALAKAPGHAGVFAQCAAGRRNLHGTFKGVVTEARQRDFQSMYADALHEFGEGGDVRPLNVAVSAEPRQGGARPARGRSLTPAQLLEESYLQASGVDVLIVNVGESVDATIAFEFLALAGFDPHAIVLRNFSTAVGRNGFVAQVMRDALHHRGFNSTSESNSVVLWRGGRSVVR